VRERREAGRRRRKEGKRKKKRGKKMEKKKREREIKVANLLMMIREGINQREIRLGMDFRWKRN